MRYVVRTHLPMVQVPVEGGWSYPGQPRFALAEQWLDTTRQSDGASKGPIAESLGLGRRASKRGLDVVSLGPGEGSKEATVMRAILGAIAGVEDTPQVVFGVETAERGVDRAVERRQVDAQGPGRPQG